MTYDAQQRTFNFGGTIVPRITPRESSIARRHGGQSKKHFSDKVETIIIAMIGAKGESDSMYAHLDMEEWAERAFTGNGYDRPPRASSIQSQIETGGGPVFDAAEDSQHRLCAYVMACVTNAGLDMLRKQIKYRRTKFTDKPLFNKTEAQAAIETLEHDARWLERLASLTEHGRTMVNLVLHKGMTIREAAEHLRITEGAARSRYYNAMKKIRGTAQTDEEATRD